MTNQRRANGHQPKINVKNFPEQDYLRAYPDVETAIKNGIFRTAYEHFIKAGRAELENGLRPNFLAISHEQNTVTAFPEAANAPSRLEKSGNIANELPQIFSDDLTCFIDEIEEGCVSGWIKNRKNNSHPILDVWIDGEKTVSFVSNIARPDVLPANPGALYVGFKFNIPRKFLNGRTHRLQICPGGGTPIALFFKEQHSKVVDFNFKWQKKTLSSVDGLSQGSIKGWLLVEGDESNEWQGGAQILVKFNGAHVAQLRANRYRPDVGKIFNADPYCGFEFIPPNRYRINGPQVFSFVTVPEGKELSGSPATIEFLSPKYEKALVGFNSVIDQLYAEITNLRREIKDLLPENNYTVVDYDIWAQKYYRNLTKTAASLKPSPNTSSDLDQLEQRPLVTIVCPTYRPNLADFELTVESVIRQTYEKWELILVDDGSNEPSLSKYLNALVSRDKRIKVKVLKENSGISSATNAGLKLASGQWIGFLDHDDLLVDVALQIMLVAALSKDALLLYSDEDKIDKVGSLSAPAFKPDWNYRLLLGVNYVCHFLMVKKEVLDKIEGFNSAYDGAQDHDFLLRVSEIISHDRIHHVPELLYHWRITDNSTALQISSKPYAIEAGIACVSDHLKRMGKRAAVKNFKESTLYKITWINTASPAVDIIIPFKDHLETTRMCVTRITEMTQYLNFRIVLVDNWSISEGLDEFMLEMSAIENVSVLRVEETFNYSRLNNLAVAKSQADMYVFMNNDLFVKDRLWLRTLVNEALADESVAVVGGKFLYPNGTIQHGGVVLGIGGIAGHIHVGIGEDDGGYGGRGYFAQELSAVTAACMLVKANVFKQVSGFDEISLPIAFNDIDFCLKVRAAGYRVIWTPEFVADHHESMSRGSDDRVETRERFFYETHTMMERWGDTLKNDPFYSKHFDLEGRPFYDLINPTGFAPR